MLENVLQDRGGSTVGEVMYTRLVTKPRWYCIHTHIDQEYTVQRHLSQQGFMAYLPLMLQESKDTTKVVPLFSGYVFVQFSRRDPWKRIHNTVGVKQLLGPTKVLPSALPDGAVESLMQSASLVNRDKLLLPGVSVIFKRGEWAGTTAVCKWSNADRVNLLMRILGREIEVEFNRQEVEDVL